MRRESSHRSVVRAERLAFISRSRSRDSRVARRIAGKNGGAVFSFRSGGDATTTLDGRKRGSGRGAVCRPSKSEASASARIMSFRRIIMRERSRRARQSVSFTYRGRFNYPIASSSPLLASRHRTAPLFYSARSRAIATQRGAARRPVFE